MSGPVLSVSVMLATLAASIIVGLAVGRKSVSLLMSFLFGVVTALVRIQYDPDPAALPGLVGYPLMCMVLNRLGGLLRRRIRLARKKRDDQAPPAKR